MSYDGPMVKVKRRKARRSELSAKQCVFIRKDLNFSQQEMADAVGVDIRTVQRREGKEVPILYEAELALRYVCLKTLGREPVL
jgi:DNA-binding transcriptional regulator YiaG